MPTAMSNKKRQKKCKKSGSSTIRMLPTKMLLSYQKDRHNPTKQSQLFLHITNMVAQQHWYHDKNINNNNIDDDDDNKKGRPPPLLQPSPYLDITMSTIQVQLLNPAIIDVIRGLFHRYDDNDHPDCTVPTMARRRLDMIRSNIGSYTRQMEDPSLIKDLMEYNATIAMVTAAAGAA